jgi:hypothetical protein
MREDFPSWGVHTRQPIVRNDEMYKSRGKIEDLTTFRAFTLISILSFVPFEQQKLL